MGVGLHQCTIHIGAGVTLVAVGDHVFFVRLFLAHHVPLEARRETGAATAAQAAGNQLLTHIFGSHLAQSIAQCQVAAACDIVFQLFRIDQPAVCQHHLLLLGEEGDVRWQHVLGQRLALRCGIRRLSGLFGNNRTRRLRCYLLINHICFALFLHRHHRPATARPHAACGNCLDVDIRLEVGDRLIDGVKNGCST